MSDHAALIVIVDPDREHGQLMARSLTSVGPVELAETAEEGWALVQAHGPEVVIADQRLVGMPGIELLNRAGERDIHVGRILLTSYGDTQATIDAIDLGRVDAYIQKPCLPHQLRITVQSVIERTRLERENVRLVNDLRAKNKALGEAVESLRNAQRRALDSERLSAIGRMISVIVNDFRNPLSVISAATSEIGRDELPASERQELAGRVVHETDRMNRICNELLEVTRASGDTISPSEESIDALVEDALSQLAEDAARSGVVIETKLASESTLRVDADRLRRAILNVGRNAIEAMAGGGTLTALTSRSDEGVSIELCDTGEGIPPELLNRVFEPFVSHRRKGSSGLGLAVVKKVVEDHGGSVAARRLASGGTGVAIQLPLYLGADHESPTNGD